MDKKNFPFGIALAKNDTVNYYLPKLMGEYNINEETQARLKSAHLFRLSDNVQYRQFDADIVLFDPDGAYYPTGDFEPIEKVKNEDIVALADENSEVELI